jgi:hypothetical protein
MDENLVSLWMQSKSHPSKEETTPLSILLTQN